MGSRYKHVRYIEYVLGIEMMDLFARLIRIFVPYISTCRVHGANQLSGSIRGPLSDVKIRSISIYVQDRGGKTMGGGDTILILEERSLAALDTCYVTQVHSSCPTPSRYSICTATDLERVELRIAS